MEKEPWKLCKTGRGEFCDGCSYDEICNPAPTLNDIGYPDVQVVDENE